MKGHKQLMEQHVRLILNPVIKEKDNYKLDGHTKLQYDLMQAMDNNGFGLGGSFNCQSPKRLTKMSLLSFQIVALPPLLTLLVRLTVDLLTPW
jgi:hypothetical protein